MTVWDAKNELLGDGNFEFAEFDGSGTPIVYLHGLGSDWHDFEGASEHPVLSQHRLIVPNLPGHGRSEWQDGENNNLNGTVTSLLALLQKCRVRDFILIGHSLGGALAILLARAIPQRVLGLVSVEGNLVEGDCGILSTRTLAYNKTSLDDGFFDELDKQLSAIKLPGYPEYRAGYRIKLTSYDAWRAYTSALVAHSADNKLLDDYIRLPCHRAYVYGNAEVPPPLDALLKAGQRTYAIACSAHWPMYSNSSAFFDVLCKLSYEFDCN